MSSKRHSMPVGPRPLQLANGPVGEGSLASPMLSPNPTTPTTPRRASSIIYNPPARTRQHRSALQRSNSVGGALDLQHSTAPERSPVTLAEKHADLLHFIAQKESKCLELRSQLAVHEAELLQLKRKWERIVSRGFTSPHNVSSPASASSFAANGYPTPSTPSMSSLVSSSQEGNGNGAVLDGIREGVQGVGRLLAAYALSPTTNASGAFQQLQSVARASSGASASAYSHPAKSFEGLRNGTHSKSSSMSTMTTSTTTSSKSTGARLSQSSQSSLDESVCASDLDANAQGEERDAEEGAEDGDGAQVLMVHDTGATPTMSPNPAFTARRDRDRARASNSSSSSNSNVGASTPGTPALSANGLGTGTETAMGVGIGIGIAEGNGKGGDSSAEAEEDFFFAQAQAQAQAQGRKSSVSPARTPLTPTLMTTGTGSATATRPPIGRSKSTSASASKDSIGALALVDIAGGPGVSAWVGSVGKTVGDKWEELQKVSTIAKNTKRASLLFSDIAYALQVGPSSSSPSPSSSSPVPSSSSLAHSYSPSPATASSTSLLDLDDSDGEMRVGAPALTPTSLLTPSLTPTSILTPTPLSLKPTPILTPTRKQQPQLHSPLSLAKTKKPTLVQVQQNNNDEDDEWNW